MVDTHLNLRGLVLSAAELRKMTDWPEALIEDYLNLLDNLVLLSGEVDTKSDKLHITYRVDTTPYEIPDDADDIFVNTDLTPIIVSLRPGTAGRQHRIINTGSTGNRVTVQPATGELLTGSTDSRTLSNRSVIILTYDVAEGWW